MRQDDPSCFCCAIEARQHEARECTLGLARGIALQSQQDGGGYLQAELTKADLSGAVLCRATLCGAGLAGANLSGAELEGANLAGSLRGE